MKLAAGIKNSLKDVTDAVSRYPLTAVFLLAAVLVNTEVLQGSRESIYGKLLLTFIVGAFLASTAQVLHERFFPAPARRLLLMGTAALLTAGYFFLVRNAPDYSIAVAVRTSALVSALFVAYIWVPTIKGEIAFHQAFMAVFKALFVSLFFSGVLFGGISIIFSAINLLFFSVGYQAYQMTANVIFILFAPMYFLSLVPDYNREDREKVARAVSCPRILEILISNIIIPLASVFTVILVLYIAINITGRFWTDNLIEPMLVSYSIVVIVVYFLAGSLDNRFAAIFKKVFPRVLIPIVLFQTLASVMKISEMGLTHNRYYAIMYGVFALLAGVVFSFFSLSRSSVVPAALICFSLISIVPPVDAFTISRVNQIATLERALIRNEFLVDNRIVPKENISREDKLIIANTLEYIFRMGYTRDLAWLPDGFEYYMDFQQTFGFSPYPMEGPGRPVPGQSRFFNRNQKAAVDVSGYDLMATIPFGAKVSELHEVKVSSGGVPYSLGWKIVGNGGYFFLRDEQGGDLITLDLQVITERLEAVDGAIRELSPEEASFTAENARARMKIVINYMELYRDNREQHQYGEAYLLVGVRLE